MDQMVDFETSDLLRQTPGFVGYVHLFDLFVPGVNYSYLWKSIDRSTSAGAAGAGLAGRGSVLPQGGAPRLLRLALTIKLL